SIHAPVLSTVPLVPVEDVDACASILQGGIWKGLECAPHPLNRAGSAKGRLIGGNLTILQTLIGTSDFPVQSGDILIIEEVDEMLYHLDRMLLHLDRAGVLSSIAGLCVGDMTDMRDNTKAYGFSSDNPYGLSAEEIIAERLKASAIPVGFGLPCGHGVRNHPLLLGAPVEMTVGANGTELRHV
ncbi:MAG: hypothetical protein HKN79_12425, partial [Flavobacteriales bacterium]|nr:hypothetical protein [Flavobacteriales bacterium]